MPPGPFDVEVQRTPGRLHVRPMGDLDIATVDRVRTAVAAREAGEALELDLSGLEFLDTSGLQLLVELHRDARADGHELSIVRGTHNVHRVFEMAGLDRVLPFTGGEA